MVLVDLDGNWVNYLAYLAVKAHVGEVHPIPGLRPRNSQHDLVGEPDRVVERKIPGDSPSPATLPDRASNPEMAVS